MRGGFRIGRILGIEILIDWSLVIIFTLITVSLGTGIFPAWHPEWTSGMIWITALMAAVLFFCSILLHELSHALMGRRMGGDIPSITLFVFGGMANLERDVNTAKAEFWMAVVGPITSLAIGFACVYLGWAISGVDSAQLENPEQVASQLGPVATLLLWLGPVNIVLALFNMVPGFPLDGGRILRAIVWGVTGDQLKATRWASGAGQLFAWVLIATGFAMILGARVPIFGSGVVGGLWLAVIGWFLSHAAVSSYQQQLVQQSLGETPVSRVMQTGLTSLAPETRLAEFVDDYLLHSSQRVFPVTRGDEFLGLVCLEDLRRTAPSERSNKTVADIMTPKDRVVAVEPREDAAEAMDRLAKAGVNQLPVIDNGRLIGLLTRESMLRWMSLDQGGHHPRHA